MCRFMAVKIEVNFGKLRYDPEADMYEWFDATIDILNNGHSFFEQFQPITKDSELAKYLVHSEWEGNAFTYPHAHANYPLFNMVLDFNLGVRHIQPNQVYVLTHDAYQTEIVFKRQADEIHLFYHLKYHRLWYDGSKIVFTKTVPESSMFVINANELINAIDVWVVHLREYLSSHHPEFIKDSLVKRSFGLDKFFNDLFGEGGYTSEKIHEWDDVEER